MLEPNASPIHRSFTEAEYHIAWTALCEMSAWLAQLQQRVAADRDMDSEQRQLLHGALQRLTQLSDAVFDMIEVDEEDESRIEDAINAVFGRNGLDDSDRTKLGLS